MQPFSSSPNVKKATSFALWSQMKFGNSDLLLSLQLSQTQWQDSAAVLPAGYSIKCLFYFFMTFFPPTISYILTSYKRNS